MVGVVTVTTKAIRKISRGYKSLGVIRNFVVKPNKGSYEITLTMRRPWTDRVIRNFGVKPNYGSYEITLNDRCKATLGHKPGNAKPQKFHGKQLKCKQPKSV